MPTAEEWAQQTGEVTVKGSSALGCQTKMVREYLRVVCRGKNDTGGVPTGARALRGGREALIVASAGVVVNLFLPVVEGTNAEILFSWSDKSHPLVVKWPRGTPAPTVVGVFEGARSPLDRGGSALGSKLCDCHRKVRGAASCDDLVGGADEDCERTWGGDCARLLACARGDPHALPECRAGWVRGGPMGRCYRRCAPGDAPCPAGFTCERDLASEPACAPD